MMEDPKPCGGNYICPNGTICKAGAPQYFSCRSVERSSVLFLKAQCYIFKLFDLQGKRTKIFILSLHGTTLGFVLRGTKSQIKKPIEIDFY